MPLFHQDPLDADFDEGTMPPNDSDHFECWVDGDRVRLNLGPFASAAKIVHAIQDGEVVPLDGLKTGPLLVELLARETPFERVTVVVKRAWVTMQETDRELFVERFEALRLGAWPVAALKAEASEKRRAV